jgi:hypothetical protein
MASSTAVAAAGDHAVVGTRKQGGGANTPPPPPPQQQQPPPSPPEQGLRCPRCDSPNTKFCYYNNYSLSQPRHFCKTCRRYWTKGGALRNVPVGGGCRKNKRSRSAASASAAVAAASSRLSLNLPVEGIAADQQAATTRLGFLGGGAPVVSSPIGSASGADYHGGAAVGMMALPRLHHAPAVGHYVPFGEWPSALGGVDVTAGGTSGHEMSGGHTGAVNSSIATSIESLSFINQDLHWKLQQQRLAAMFLGPPPSSGPSVHMEGGAAVQEHVSGGAFLQMAGAPAMETVPAATSWFMDSSYVLPSPIPTANNTGAAATNGGNVHSARSSANHDNATDNNNCGSAIPAWGDMSTFTLLP